MPNQNAVAFNLKTLRNNSGKTQITVATELHLSIDAYRKWEHNHKSLDISDIYRLATVFNLSPVETFIQLTKGIHD